MRDFCLIGDCRESMREMIAQGVRLQMCITSPPYWGLRDYGIEGQLGLEPTPEQYVANMVEVFRLVRELLADDGTLWLNLGDSYASNTKGTGGTKSLSGGGTLRPNGRSQPQMQSITMDYGTLPIKPKDLCGVPWRVAFALQADGWYLRSDIIWAKPNPMPESVTDRPTKAHEYLFLLAKRERYFYDNDAIREPTGNEMTWEQWDEARHQWGAPDTNEAGVLEKYAGQRKTDGGHSHPNGRNRRTVWTIAMEPYADAHFATFPTALVEPCILAGTRVGDTVFDPFLGSGTVAQVAQNLGRHWLGCELNPEYVKLQAARTAQLGLAFTA